MAFQINPAHTGSITFAAGFTPPLTQVWSTNFTGNYGSLSYPIIADGKLFVVAYGNDVYAVDLHTGATVWERLFSGSGFLPAYDKGQLFLTDATGHVTALKGKSGKLDWSVLPNGATTTHSAPIAVNGTVYVADVANYNSEISALDEETGRQTWWNITAGGDYDTPAFGDDGIFVALPCNYYKFAEGDGTMLWHTAPQGSCYGSATAATYSQSKLYIHDSTNYVLNTADGTMLAGYPGSATPAFFKASNGRRYMVTVANNQVYAIDVKRGTVAWSFLPDDGSSAAGFPIAVNGIVMAMSYDGHLYAIDGVTGAQLWKGTAGSYGQLPYIAAGEGVVAVASGSSLTVFTPQ